MSLEKPIIKGVVAFDSKRNEIRFIDWLEKSDFTNGTYRSDFSCFVYLHCYEIQVVIPDNFDPIKPQLEQLDEQEKQLKIKYQTALNHIQVQRNNLLAIENKPSI